MRALAITGIVTAAWIPLIIAGSDMRATPPSRRMSAGTRSRAMTAAAPASCAIFAWSGVTTSMITPPVSISARPALTRKVASSRIAIDCTRGPLGPRGPDRPNRTGQHQTKCHDAIGVSLGVTGVYAVGERLDHAQQGGVRADVGGAVGG